MTPDTHTDTCAGTGAACAHKSDLTLRNAPKIILLTLFTCGTYLLYAAAKSTPLNIRKASDAFVAWRTGAGTKWAWLGRAWIALACFTIAVELGTTMYLGCMSFAMTHHTAAYMKAHPGKVVPGFLFSSVFIPFFFIQVATIGTVFAHVGLTLYMGVSALTSRAWAKLRRKA